MILIDFCENDCRLLQKVLSPNWAAHSCGVDTGARFVFGDEPSIARIPEKSTNPEAVLTAFSEMKTEAPLGSKQGNQDR
jgi:hypothetical protein